MHVINHDDIDDNDHGDDDDDCENVHINCCNVIFGPIVSGFSSVQLGGLVCVQCAG